MKYYFLLIAFVFLTSCSMLEEKIDARNALAAAHWAETEVGEIKGKLVVQWQGPDKFIYIPDQREPLSFIRKKDGKAIDIITPGKMYTDGGSIPRVLWIDKDFSPWMFGPAYIVHDWLFELKHCNLPGNEKYDHHIAAQIMAEVIKTQLVNTYGDMEYVSEHMSIINAWNNIFLAVDGYSKVLWDDGVCEAILE